MHDTGIIDNYVRWLETLTESGVHRVGMFAARDIRYRTPEGEGCGANATAAIYARMFADGATVKTKILDRATGLDERTVYLRWDRIVTTRTGQIHGLSGMSEILIGMEGKIVSIIEHWNSVSEAPKYNFITRWLKRK